MELYINGELCDTFGSEEVALSRAVNKIGDIQFRDGDYTNNFDLPTTARNKLIFGNAQVVNSATNIPYERLTARIEVNGNIVSMGYAVLLESSEVFRVSYYGANADWFKIIGDKSLQDLDLLALNHKWTATNVRDARLNNTAWTDAYNYPNVDYGEWGTVYWYTFYLGMYVKYLVQKIFSEAGFTIAGNFWDNDSNLPIEMIPFCGNWRRDKIYSERNTFSCTIDNTVQATDLTSLAIPDIQGVNGTTTTDCDYDFDPSLDFSYASPSTITVQREDHHLVLDGGDITINYNLTFNRNSTPAVDIAAKCNFIYVDENGDQASLLIADLSAAAANSTGHNFTGTINLTISRGAIFFSIGDLFIVAGSSFDFAIVPNELDVDDLNIDPTFSYITVASILPDVKQKDLLVTVFNQHCLLFDTDHQINYVNLFTFNDVIGNIPNAKDWSDKLDISEKPKISYLFENYAQTNKFLYKVDDNNQYLLDQPDFAGGEILIDNENLESEKVVFQSEFCSVIRQWSFSGTFRIAWIPKFPGGDEAEVPPYIGRMEYTSDWLLTMDGYAQEPSQPTMYDISFSGTFIPEYYDPLTNILTKAKLVSASFLLNSVDVQSLDFSKPVYVGYFQAYFYINQVKQFKLTSVETTEVELVRIG